MDKLPIEKVTILARFGDSDVQALAEEVIEYRNRTCQTCSHGIINPKYPLEEIGVKCDILNGYFTSTFSCNMWEPKA